MWKKKSFAPFVFALVLAAIPWAAGKISFSQARAAGLEGLTPNTAAAGIYGGDHLSSLGPHTSLVYDYRLEGKLMDEPFTDEIVLDLTRADDGSTHGFDVSATLFARGPARKIGPIVASTFNPLLLIFFQRDVNQMSRGTGGSNHYFRNVIRHAMAVPGNFEETRTTARFGDETVAARRISFTPFADDSNRAQMKSFARKTYAVTLSEAVPGGILELSTTTATGDDSDATPMLRESYRLREARP